MPDHLDDVASDFSAIHRVDDIRSLSGPAFFRLAYRLAAYQGVIQALWLAEQQQQEPAAPGQARDRPAGRDVNPGTRQSLEAMQAQLSAQAPGMPSLFSFGTMQRAG